MKNISDIGKMCCGCKSCLQTCNKNAISFEENDEGFLYPKVDKNKCIECGKCVKTCPVRTLSYKNNGNIPACYAVQAKKEIERKSSSGGFFQ